MRILCVVGLVSAGALVLAACASARRPGAETIAPSEAAADRGGTSNPVDEDDEGPAFENLTPEQAATLSSAETAARQLLQSPDFKALVTSIPASHERGTATPTMMGRRYLFRWAPRFRPRSGIRDT